MTKAVEARKAAAKRRWGWLRAGGGRVGGVSSRQKFHLARSLSILKRIWSILHALKMVSSAMDAQSDRASITSLTTAWFRHVLRSKTVCELSCGMKLCFFGRGRVWSTKHIRPSIESKIVPNYVQRSMVVFCSGKSIGPSYALLKSCCVDSRPQPSFSKVLRDNLFNCVLVDIHCSKVGISLQ